MNLQNGGKRPEVETHNIVRSGGYGNALITDDPLFETGYRLSAASLGLNSASTAYAPPVDLYNVARGSQPDRGARERTG